MDCFLDKFSSKQIFSNIKLNVYFVNKQFKLLLDAGYQWQQLNPEVPQEVTWSWFIASLLCLYRWNH